MGTSRTVPSTPTTIAGVGCDAFPVNPTTVTDVGVVKDDGTFHRERVLNCPKKRQEYRRGL